MSTGRYTLKNTFDLANNLGKEANALSAELTQQLLNVPATVSIQIEVTVEGTDVVKKNLYISEGASAEVTKLANTLFREVEDKGKKRPGKYKMDYEVKI